MCSSSVPESSAENFAIKTDVPHSDKTRHVFKGRSRSQIDHSLVFDQTLRQADVSFQLFFI